MSAYLPNKVSESDAFRSDWNKMVEAMRRFHLLSSPDIEVNEKSNGTTLTVSKRIKQKIGGSGGGDYFAYDVSASYNVGDEIYVSPNKSYQGLFLIAPSASIVPPLCAGAFRVVQPVPSLISGSTRPAGNLLYPIYPIWSTSSIVTVSGSVK